MAKINQLLNSTFNGTTREHFGLALTSMDNDLLQAGRLATLIGEYVLHPEDHGAEVQDTVAIVDGLIALLGQLGLYLDCIRIGQTGE